MKRTIILCLLALTLTAIVLTAGCTSTASKSDPNDLSNYPAQSLGVLHINIVKRYSDALLPRDVSFVFEPATDTVKFHHKMMGDNIWVSLEKNERTLFRQAIEQYLKAFADKSLTQEGSKKKGAFGKAEVLMSWGLFGSAHEAYPVLRFDYQFITPQRPYLFLQQLLLNPAMVQTAQQYALRSLQPSVKICSLFWMNRRMHSLLKN